MSRRAKVIAVSGGGAALVALFGTSASLVVWLWRKTPRGYAPDEWWYSFPDDEDDDQDAASKAR
jgi:hypothetical protein